jgi:hypothetical protein
MPGPDGFRSFTLTGIGGTKALSLIYPHKRKSQRVRSGLLGGRRVSVMFCSVERCLERIGFLLLLPLWSIGLISQFLDHFTDVRTPWTSDQLVAKPLPKHRTT